MAVVGIASTSTSWLNSDGLYVKFGASEGTRTRGGEYNSINGMHWVDVRVDLSTLPTVASANKQILADNVTIPNGAFVERVSVVCLKETTGSSAAFNLGLVDQDRSTEIDFDGLLAAATSFAGGTDLGEVSDYYVGTSLVGALVGTKITNTGLLVGYATTADFTAGVLDLRVYFTFHASDDY